MEDRLNDLSEDLAHDDFTDRRTLQNIEVEIEMQRTLARRLRDAAREAYVVVREDEVADSKKPDIRLAAIRGEHKAAIEVKIADNWSVVDLEDALRTQLVGQYLRHANCRAGCLLLTYSGKKGFWVHPQTRNRLTFRGLVDYLRQIANELEKGDEIRLLVYPIDLTGAVAEED
jgi:hypothetical protein